MNARGPGTRNAGGLKIKKYRIVSKSTSIGENTGPCWPGLAWLRRGRESRGVQGGLIGQARPGGPPGPFLFVGTPAPGISLSCGSESLALAVAVAVAVPLNSPPTMED